MTENSASLRFRVIMLVLTGGMILFAFLHSSMPASVSAGESGGVAAFLMNTIHSLGIRLDGVSAELADHIVRKTAHFTEYTAIGVLLTCCAYSFHRMKPYKYSAHILFVGLFTAVIDEAIQLNVVGRSGEVKDVLLDFSGVVFGALSAQIFFAICRRIRKMN